MKLVFVRHAEPDYDHDSLTIKGFREAELLASRIARMKPQHLYVSPLGRAIATAAPTMRLLGKGATEYEWLQEFRGKCIRPGESELSYCWDWLPESVAEEPMLFDCDKWKEASVFEGTNVKTEYEYVTASLDNLLMKHGLERNGRIYHVNEESHDTLVFFCHYAVTCVFLSHLLNISPYMLWNGTAMQASSVTTLVTEERTKGNAYFRMLEYGDISHLYEAGEEPSFMVRFCECYSDDTRH